MANLRLIMLLAWRNIWRNRKRTFITASSILFALFFAIVMRSFQTGSFENLLDNVIKDFTGYIQLHRQGYWEEKDLNNSFLLGSRLMDNIRADENVSTAVPRLESFALASSGTQTKGVMVTGTDPAADDSLTHLSRKVTEGRYLFADEKGVLISGKLAEFLKIRLNDTLILIAQGFHGVSAADKFPVAGILHFPSPELDNKMVIMPLGCAQEFYSAPGRATTVALDLHDRKAVAGTVSRLRNTLRGEGLEMMPWEDILKEVVDFIKVKTASGYLMLSILYAVIAFGVFGTVLMMTTERIREFGMVCALGMQKAKLSLIASAEMAMIGIIGILAGIAVTIPVVLYFFYNPVKLTGEAAKSIENYGLEPLMPFAMDPGIFLHQSLVVVCIVALSLAYPVWIISKMKTIDAMRSKF